jgi:hypothetical protein
MYLTSYFPVTVNKISGLLSCDKLLLTYRREVACLVAGSKPCVCVCVCVVCGVGLFVEVLLKVVP